jgi:phenylacetate-CoA ligase
MFDPAVDTRPWQDQFSRDDVQYRRQIEYLLARSSFYQRKLREVGFTSAEKVGGLEAIVDLPLTTKNEIRVSYSEDHPMGTHVAVSMREIVRIFSTSGTTGTPSYIPLTAHDLEKLGCDIRAQLFGFRHQVR